MTDQPSLLLVLPSSQYEAAFREMVEEFQAAGEYRYTHDLPLIRNNFPAYLAKLNRYARGQNLPAGRVPQLEYWLVDPSVPSVLGSIRIRLRMTPRLEQIDGQIGYCVRPSARCKGYATYMLSRVIVKLTTDGWQRVLITCNADNSASARVIEKNGGVLENQVIEKETGKLISRYWIPLRQDTPL